MPSFHKASLDPNGKLLGIVEVQTSDLEQSPTFRALHKAFTEVMSRMSAFEVPITPRNDREPLRVRFNPQFVIGSASAWIYKKLDLHATSLIFAGGFQHEDAAINAAQAFFKASAERNSQKIVNDLATIKQRPLVAMVSTLALDEFETAFADDIQMALTTVFFEKTIWKSDQPGLAT